MTLGDDTIIYLFSVNLREVLKMRLFHYVALFVAANNVTY